MVFSTPKKESGIFHASIICSLLGLCIRILYCIAYPIQPRDAYLYRKLIIQWEETGDILDPISFFPLSLWILKMPYHFLKCDVFYGCIVINVVIGLLLIIASIVVTSLLFDNTYLLFLSGCIVATHPALVRFSCSCLRENTYLFFSLLMLFTLLKYYKKPSYLSLIGTAFFGALAFLCRLEGLEMLFFVNIIIISFYCFKVNDLSKTIFHSLFFSTLFIFFVVFIIYSLNLKIVSWEALFSKIDFMS